MSGGETQKRKMNGRVLKLISEIHLYRGMSENKVYEKKQNEKKKCFNQQKSDENNMEKWRRLWKSGRMDHGRMDHGRMDHGRMDHGRMDHGRMDHGRMDHGRMDHRRIEK